MRTVFVVEKCSYTLSWFYISNHHKILTEKVKSIFLFMSYAKATATESKRDSGERSPRCDWNMFLLKSSNQK